MFIHLYTTVDLLLAVGCRPCDTVCIFVVVVDRPIDICLFNSTYILLP